MCTACHPPYPSGTSLVFTILPAQRTQIPKNFSSSTPFILEKPSNGSTGSTAVHGTLCIAMVEQHVGQARDRRVCSVDNKTGGPLGSYNSISADDSGCCGGRGREESSPCHFFFSSSHSFSHSFSWPLRFSWRTGGGETGTAVAAVAAGEAASSSSSSR